MDHVKRNIKALVTLVTAFHIRAMPISLIPLMMGLFAMVPPGRPAAPPTDRIDSLRASIERRIAEVKGAVVGVAFRDVGTPDSVFINADDKTIERYAKGPWKTFELEVKDDGTHRPTTTELKIPISDPGMWLIEIANRERPTARLSRGLTMLESTAVVIKGTNNGELLSDHRRGQSTWVCAPEKVAFGAQVRPRSVER